MSKLIVGVAIGAALLSSASAAFAGQNASKSKVNAPRTAYNMVSTDSSVGGYAAASRLQVYVAGHGLAWQTIQPENTNR